MGHFIKNRDFFFIQKDFILFMSVCTCPCVCTCTCKIRCLGRPEMLRVPLELSQVFTNPPDCSRELNFGPRDEQVLLTAEPSLQSLKQLPV